MSDLRVVEIPADESLLKEVGRDLGFKTLTNTRIRGYATRNMTGSVVIQGPGGDIGIVKMEDGNKRLVFDNMSTIAKEVIPKYVDKYIKRHLKTEAKRMETKNEIVYVINV